MAAAHTLSVDLETFSSVDLPSAGVARYVESPDFEILLLAYSTDDGPTTVIDLASGETIPGAVVEALRSDAYEKHAFNAVFEITCLQKIVGGIQPEQWRCDKVHAMYCGYPGSLEAAGKALGLPAEKQKLATGKALIRYFCSPCKPTKSNGGRTRNLPHHDPDRWRLFKEYNAQDVETEKEIERRLAAFPIPDALQQQWVTDTKINDRGVAIDADMVEGALAIGQQTTEALMREAREITGLENPNSVGQMLGWLEEHGVSLANLQKETVADALKGGIADGDAQRALEIRQELGKTSTKKYDAIEDCVCNDGRVRGLLQFYGANRTGRWAGRLVQVQNLPRTYIKQLDLARQCVTAHNANALRAIFGSIPDTLSQLIRTAFIAEPGKVLIDADFSAIEARVIAWLAGEEWRLDAFREGKDIYCESASRIYGVPVVKHGENGHLRAKGKVAELACIAEGQPVLTDRGPVPIEQVTTNDRVWDGENWVNHSGVIYKGEREVITYEGLTATPDHLVWIEGQPRPVQFGIAAARGAHLVQTEHGGEAVRLGEDHQCGEALEPEVEQLLRADKMHGMRCNTMAGPEQPAARRIEGMPELLAAEADTEMAGQKAHRGEAEMREPERQGIPQLWGARNQVQLRERDGSGALPDRDLRAAGTQHGDRSHRQHEGLRAGEPSVRDAQGEQREQTDDGLVEIRAEVLAVCVQHDDPEAVQRNDARGDHQRRRGRGKSQTKVLAENRRTARVYDIRDAGQHHRFTVSGKLVHNCGFGGSVGAMQRMGGSDLNMTDDELQQIVNDWRAASPKIVKLWYDLQDAAISAINGAPRTTHGLTFAREYNARTGQSMLTMRLPSGRKLFYLEPKIGENRWGGPSITYLGVDQTTKQWSRIETYSGKIAENATQSIARDCLAVAIERVAAAGLPVVFHIHDEIVIEAPRFGTDEEMLAKVARLMTIPIPWAPGLPLAADGWVGGYFRKD